MPSSVVGPALLRHRIVHLDCSVAACKPLAGARITSSPAGDKRTDPGRRTAHLLARAYKQSMDSSALIAPPKQNKQVTFASQTKFCKRLVFAKPAGGLVPWLTTCSADLDASNSLDVTASSFNTRAHRR